MGSICNYTPHCSALDLNWRVCYMEPKEESLILKYSSIDNKLAELVKEHRQLNKKVDTMSLRRFLNSKDTSSLKVLKILKLRVRQKIASRLRELENTAIYGLRHGKSAC